MKRSLDMPTAKERMDRLTYRRDRIYRTPVGSAGGPKKYPQVYQEQCKYKIKKRKLVDFTDAELDLNSDDFECNSSE